MGLGTASCAPCQGVRGLLLVAVGTFHMRAALLMRVQVSSAAQPSAGTVATGTCPLRQNLTQPTSCCPPQGTPCFPALEVCSLCPPATGCFTLHHGLRVPHTAPHPGIPFLPTRWHPSLAPALSAPLVSGGSEPLRLSAPVQLGPGVGAFCRALLPQPLTARLLPSGSCCPPTRHEPSLPTPPRCPMTARPLTATGQLLCVSPCLHTQHGQGQGCFTNGKAEVWSLCPAARCPAGRGAAGRAGRGLGAARSRA